MVTKGGEINFDKSMSDDTQKRFHYRSDEAGHKLVHKKDYWKNEVKKWGFMLVLYAGVALFVAILSSLTQLFTFLKFQNIKSSIVQVSLKIKKTWNNSGYNFNE